MKFKCEIQMDNAAFVDDPFELERILVKIAKQITAPPLRDLPFGNRCMDVNGNCVGEWAIEGEVT